MSIIQPDRSHAFQVLDPCLLGRPVHLLPAFAARLADALGSAIASPGGRRYWGAYRLDSLRFEHAPHDASLRWLGVSGAYGQATVAFERSLLLGLLEGRYARRSAPTGAPVQRDPAGERVTATEERLAATLAQQLANLVGELVSSGLAAAGGALPSAASAGAATPGERRGTGIVPAAAPGKAGWVLRAVLRPQYGRRETDDPALRAPDGQLWIGLDHAFMAHVLQGLAAERGGARGTHGSRGAREPLAASLQVRLEGRLVTKEVMLATLFDLKVGDVIPVSVGRADVLLDESRLFTATVAESRGKLCLTSFEDAE